MDGVLAAALAGADLAGARRAQRAAAAHRAGAARTLGRAQPGTTGPGHADAADRREHLVGVARNVPVSDEVGHRAIFTAGAQDL